jgi:acetyl esterase/lipase
MRFTAWFFVFPVLITTLAAGGQRVPLWENDAPGQVDEGDDRDADPLRPTLDVYLPEEDKTVGTAIVICPGGGYGTLMMSYEGGEVAEFFQQRGVAAFVLRYRHAPRYRHPIPGLDAARAIRFVRFHADRYRIAADRIGVMGFSAGGHLAATAATQWDRSHAESPDPIERTSSRPDFAVLCYAVISMDETVTHSGSRRNLLGENPSAELVRRMSLETQVNQDTPPVFILQTEEDQAVPAENSLRFFAALRRAGVPAELHVFGPGRHGIGLNRGPEPTRVWPDLLIAWMTHRGLCGKEITDN